jgi:hypothetical protein
MLDLHFVCPKCLVNGLNVIVPDALLLHIAMVSSNFLVLLPWRFLLHAMMPDTSSSFWVHGSSGIQDWFFPDLVKPWEVLPASSGLIPLAHALCLDLRYS